MNIETLKELIQKEAERNEDVWDFKEEVFKLIDLFEKDNKITVSGHDILKALEHDKEVKERRKIQ